MCREVTGAEPAAAVTGVSAVRSRVCSLAKGRSRRLYSKRGGKGERKKAVNTTYQALYRKYRPRSFDDVWGQENITETLKQQIMSGRTSHAYLFVGTRGTGKTTCAKLLARAVNCEHPVDGSPCGECAACRGIEAGSIMDVVEIDAASNNGVDNIRALRDEAVFSPAEVKKRVYIVDEVHMLSASAFNALLKILEEPPEHLMFILATTELRKVPATILSRCQRFNFRRLDAEVITRRLKYVAARENIALTDGAARLLARLADGGMRDALSLLDQCSGRERIDEAAVLEATGAAGGERISSLLDAVIKRDSAAALGIFAGLWQDGKDPAGVLGDLSVLMRDALILSVAPRGGAALLSGAYDEESLRRVGSFMGREELLYGMSAVQEGVNALRDSPSARTTAELTLLRLCNPSGGEDALAARISRLEAALAGGISLPAPEPEPEPETKPEPAPEPETKPEPAPKPEAKHEPQPEPAPEPEAKPEPVAKPEAKPEPQPEPEPAPAPDDEDAPPWTDDDAPPPPDDGDAPPAGGFIPPEPVKTPEPEIARAPEPAAAPAAEPAAEPAADEPAAEHEAGAFDWNRFVALLSPHIIKGYAIMLRSAAQASGRLDGDVVTVSLEEGILFNALNNPRTLEFMREAACSVVGREVTVRLQSTADAQESARRSLRELEQFREVTFKRKDR